MADDTQLDAGFRLRLPQQLKDRLQEAAAADGRSAGSMARRLLARALDEPLNGAERATFGHDAVRSPVTGIPYEQGVGAHSPELQDRIAEAELKAGRPLAGHEVARILHGDGLDNAAADAAASLEELK